MSLDMMGGLNVTVCGGEDREGGGTGPVVILLHGFGAPGHDLVGLWRVLDVPRETRFVFPEAPVDLGWLYGAGHAWWRIDIAALERLLSEGRERDLSDEVPEGMPQARARVV